MPLEKIYVNFSKGLLLFTKSFNYLLLSSKEMYVFLKRKTNIHTYHCYILVFIILHINYSNVTQLYFGSQRNYILNIVQTSDLRCIML